MNWEICILLWENERSRSENTRSAAAEEDCTNKTSLHSAAQAESSFWWLFYQNYSSLVSYYTRVWKATYNYASIICQALLPEPSGFSLACVEKDQGAW